MLSLQGFSFSAEEELATEMKDLLSIDFFHPKSKLGYLQRHFYSFSSDPSKRLGLEQEQFE